MSRDLTDNPRYTALCILLQVEKGEGYSHILINSALTSEAHARDRAFIKRLCEGVLEKQLELDYRIDRVSSLPARKLKPVIRVILRMGIYQILYMDSVPDHAACNESVRLVMKKGMKNLRGFVNGVLRNIASEGLYEIKLSDFGGDWLSYLSIRYSMPLWIIKKWLEESGEDDSVAIPELERLLSSFAKGRPLCIRVSSVLDEEEKKKAIEALKAELAGKCEKYSIYDGEPVKGIRPDYCLMAYGCSDISSLSGFREGRYTIQDVSSMVAIEAAGIRRGDTVADLCAAPGGKTLLASEKACAEGRVISGDISSEKLFLIEDSADRMGYGNITIKCWDAASPIDELAEKCDVVICDVPCSGLGVVARKKDIRYRISPEDIEDLTAIQRAIVKNAIACLKPGGVLLYSTCTISRPENQDMTEWIRTLPGMREEISMQLLPHLHNTDGFYFSKFKKNPTI